MLAEPVAPARRRRTPKNGPSAQTPRSSNAAPFTIPHWRSWTSDLILDTGDSWSTEDFQDAFVFDVFEGIPEVWLIIPEGNGKTTLLAGLALYHCEFRPFASVPVAAASREQAEIMYRQAEGFVLRSPRLHAPVHSAVQAAKGKRKTEVPRFTALEGYRRINHHAGGRIQVFAADDRTGDGVIPTLGIIDEPHRQRNLSLYRTWSGKMAKRGGQLAAISTAGTPGSDFEETRDRIRETATETIRDGSFLRSRSNRVVMHEFAVPAEDDPEDMVHVKRANPLSTITVETLTEKFDSPTMTMHHWLRFVCNRATQDDDAWLGPEGARIWADLERPYDLVPGAKSWVGVDVALKHDTTAVVIVQERADLVREDGSKTFHARARIFWPTENRPIDVTDVMQHLRDLSAEYDVEAVSYDPRFFDVPAIMLGDEGLTMVEVPQSIERMTAACGSLYEAINRGQMTHDEDRAFTNQVLGAAARFGDRGFTLAKGKSHGKIDAAIALVMAYDQTLRHVDERPRPSKYETQDLLTI